MSVSPHSLTYTEPRPENIVHKTRLKTLLRLLASLPLSDSGAWADFGCSDGFILELIRAHIVPQGWQLQGYDFSDELLELAMKRRIAGASFQRYDLNLKQESPGRSYDVITCFETLEHLGNYRQAVDNLIRNLKGGGTLIISFPDETGVPGLLKFFSRFIVRRDPYSGFFTGDRKASDYVQALLTGRDTEPFRDANVSAWPHHLGFNYRNVMNYIGRTYMGTLELRETRRSFIGFNRIYVFHRKQDESIVS